MLTPLITRASLPVFETWTLRVAVVPCATVPKSRLPEVVICGPTAETLKKIGSICELVVPNCAPLPLKTP